MAVVSIRKNYVGVTQPGYEEVELLPQQTGLRGSRFVTVSEAAVQRNIDPQTGEDRGLPKVKDYLYDERNIVPRQFGLFVPRTSDEATEIVDLINKERAEEEKNPINVNQFNYQTNQLSNVIRAEKALQDEVSRRADPYKYYISKFKDEYSPSKLKQATENSSSIFQLFRDPKKYAQDKQTVLSELLKSSAPSGRNDFIMYGDVVGSLAGFKGAKTPGVAQGGYKSLADEVLESNIFK